MSNNLRWTLVLAVGAVTGAIIYVVTTDVILSIAGLLIAFSIARFFAHPGATG